MPEIALSQGRVAIVDEEDFAALDAHKWSYSCGYAVRNDSLGLGRGKRRVLMHRQITGAQKGLVVDHVNGNGIDNRRENLRVCTTAENCRNQRKRSTNTSGAKGVHWSVVRRRWCAQIVVGYRHVMLGYFATAAEAAAAYRTAAKLLHGDFANPEGIHVSVSE